MVALDRIGAIAHSIAGGAGIFGLSALSKAASELEEAINERLDDGKTRVNIEKAIDDLIAEIEQA